MMHIRRRCASSAARCCAKAGRRSGHRPAAEAPAQPKPWPRRHTRSRRAYRPRTVGGRACAPHGARCSLFAHALAGLPALRTPAGRQKVATIGTVETVELEERQLWGEAF